MANEQQYYQPIVQAMVATQQRQQEAERLKAEIAWRNQQAQLQQHQLDQSERRMDIEKGLRDAEVEHMKGQMANEADVMHARQFAEIQHSIMNGMNPSTLGQNAPMAPAAGQGPLGQGAILPNPQQDPNKPAPSVFVGGQQTPISQLPNQADMLNALHQEAQAKIGIYGVHPDLQKSFSEGGMGLPAQAPKEMIDQALRLYEAKANLMTNLSAKNDALDKVNEMKKYQVDQNTDMRRDVAGIMASVRGGSKEDARGDRSYQFHVGQIQKEAIPIDSLMSRYSRVVESLNQNNPLADSVIAPELLSMMAGGQGSGLRMTQPEINAIVGGRNKYEALQAWAQKWTTDPSKGSILTPDQRQQIRALSSAIGQKLQAKQALLNQARQDLVNTNDPQAHRQVFSNLQTGLTNVDTPQSVKFKSPSGAIREFNDPAQIELFRKTPGFTEVK